MAEQRAPTTDDAAETPTRSAAADATRAQVEAESKTSPRTGADMEAPRSDVPDTRETPPSAPRRRQSTTTDAKRATGSRRRSSAKTDAASATTKAAKPARHRGSGTADAATANRAPSVNGSPPNVSGSGQSRARTSGAGTAPPSSGQAAAASAGTSAAPAASSADRPGIPPPLSTAEGQPTMERGAQDALSSATDRATSTASQLYDAATSDDAGDLVKQVIGAVRSAPKGVLATVGVLFALLLYWRIRR
jgi:hypothetical protein